MTTGDPAPQHPGEVLRLNYLEPAGITAYDLAKSLHVTESTINNLISGQTGLTVGLAIRLARAFPLSVQEWIALQRDYDQHHKHSRDSA
ncbi:HigA family addiction module antitoxin [Corynebacterium pacaense]|uniref:HigA family addiction module antitoxin n=1 Tax=Corynebacterium pacaense TaxID=1816684 RepID=UPI0009BB9BD7|nr:HigA family addiction module antitoxin [Corynebacterium pacaense]